MRICCSDCGKSVSEEVREGTIIRAFVACPECIEKRTDNLRDEFAGKYGAALVGDVEVLKSVIAASRPNSNTVEQEVAEQAYDYADAMLEARKR